MPVPWSELHSVGFPLLQRFWIDLPGVSTIFAPEGALWVRASLSAAGGFRDGMDGFGGGAAFAFEAEAVEPGDTFTVQIGDSAFSRSSVSTVLGDSFVKRGDTSTLCYADRGRPDGSPGLAANSIGSIVRSGSASTTLRGGTSAGDAADTHARGFGGRGACWEPVPYSAWYGGGGGRKAGRSTPLVAAGDGLGCIEFFAYNPGY